MNHREENTQKPYQLSFKQYRLFDLIFFTILLLASELLSSLIPNSSINDIYFSLSVFIIALVLYRWNFYGMIPCIIAYSIFSIIESIRGSNFINSFLINTIANSFCIFIVFIFHFVSKQLIDKYKIMKILYVMLIFILISIGKGFIAIIINEGKFFSTIGYYLFHYQPISIFISIILCVLLANHQSLFMDQKQYITSNLEERD